MNLLNSYRDNLHKILTCNALSGMKVLLLDDECTRLIGMTYSLTKILNTDIFLVRRLSDVPANFDKSLSHLKAIVFLRPTEESVASLCAQLRSPRYHEYHIFFVNGSIDEGSSKSISLLRTIAEVRGAADIVKQVQSFFFDAFVVSPRLYSAERFLTSGLYHNNLYWRAEDHETWQRSLHASVSALALLRASPEIRFHRPSTLAKLFADDLNRELNRLRGMNSSLFSRPGSKSKSTVLVIDRMTDPVTPLLQCWLYQSMVHEQIGISYNRVSLANVPNIKDDMKEVILSCAPITGGAGNDASSKNLEHDSFFSEYFCKNFGEVGAAIKGEVSKYGSDLDQTSRLNSIQDMQRFVDKYPQIRARANQVSKHVAILSELSRLTSKHSLMESSELEQKLACDDSHADAYNEVNTILRSPSVTFENKLNIVMLYALRYETNRSNNIAGFKETLRNCAPSAAAGRRVKAVDEILRLAGSTKRGIDIFGGKSVWSKMGSILGSNTLGGVENVFTRHKPMILGQLENLTKGKLPLKDFPLVNGGNEGNGNMATPETLFIFFVGGVTYEESASIHSFAEANPLINVLIGGTGVVNSKMFKDSLLKNIVSEEDNGEDESEPVNLTLDMF